MTSSLNQAFGIDKKSSLTSQSYLESYDLRLGEPKISPFPSDVFEELITLGNINNYYPSHGDFELRRMILEIYYPQNSIEQIAITHGTIGAIDFIFRANLDSDSEILLPDPGFPPYVKLAEFSKAKIKKYLINLSDHSETFLDWDQLESLITEKTKLLLLNSPHNPSGKILNEKDIIRFEEVLSKYPQLSFVMDEVYRDLIYTNKKHYDFSRFIKRGYVVGSFSKVFPLQGARIGWVLTNIADLKKLSPYFDFATGAMSSFGQEIVKLILKKQLSFKSNYYHALQSAKAILNRYHVDYIHPEGAFFLFIKYEISDIAATEELSMLGVDVVPGSSFGVCGINYIRASFGQKTDVLEKAFSIIGKHWKKNHFRVMQ